MTRFAALGLGLALWFAAPEPHALVRGQWRTSVVSAQAADLTALEAALQRLVADQVGDRPAETHHEHEGKKGVVLTCEFLPGHLFRSLRFPKPVNADKVKAEFKNGMLVVTAGIANDSRARMVEITAG